MNVYYLHFSVKPAQPTPAIQIGYADVCCICEDQQTAEAWARDLILSHRFLPGELLAAAEIQQGRSVDLDELEAMLLQKAQQRDPMCALQLTVAGEDRPTVGRRDLGIPSKGAKH